jgi:nitroimidazol reductase NimA-like FMN-containing flavoprotein (pyridoxamine 5'-phosphate oxidase superfamily)
VTDEEIHLTREECVELLGTEVVGRLAAISHDRPEVFPVNYVMDGDAVVFRTGVGTKLFAAAAQPVAFEVDHIRTENKWGWSVVVHGVAQEVTEAERADVLQRLEGLPLEVWAAGRKPYVLRIAPHEISGRWVGARRPPLAH